MAQLILNNWYFKGSCKSCAEIDVPTRLVAAAERKISFHLPSMLNWLITAERIIVPGAYLCQ